MKSLLVLLVLLVGCESTSMQPKTEVPKEEAAVTPPTFTPTKLVLAWGTSRQDWTDHLVKEIKASNLKPSVKYPCKKVDQATCFAHLVSIMAKFESGFKPEVEYKESFNDSKGNPVISRGLLQMSIESANQKAYGCGIKKEKDLHDPFVNLSCAVKIIAYQANRGGALMAEPKIGCAAYYSVCRASSKSNKKILDYLAGY